MPNQETNSAYPPSSLEAELDDLRRAQFAMNDSIRCAQGDALDTLGLGPHEHPSRVIASGPHWRLREYADHAPSPTLLIVAAPIKRPYIWDLAPSVSAIGYCLQHSLNVRMLEWMPGESHGLEECTRAIATCVAEVTQSSAGRKPFLIGHSLGGTLAAIFAALAPDSLQGLVLLGAPVCFAPATSPFRDSLVAMVPPGVSESASFPGSLLSQASALASPSTFVWSRLMDAFLSVTDAAAFDVHVRVERWALDEVPLPGKLVHEIVDWLYREDRLCRGTLTIGDTRVGPSRVSIPVLGVVSGADDVAPLASIKPFLEAMPGRRAHIIEHPGEIGVCLQHLAILVGKQAQARVWPQIITWLNARAAEGEDAWNAEGWRATGTS